MIDILLRCWWLWTASRTAKIDMFLVHWSLLKTILHATEFVRCRTNKFVSYYLQNLFAEVWCLVCWEGPSYCYRSSIALWNCQPDQFYTSVRWRAIAVG
ncbi:hypothetical protein O6H91_20G070800 [Diphasiastrum complanatum]|uniref:Uncharacterized protein n=1 Tax=Diphasiastrum complanatum TaxID=34168 RepID=A0ACC2ARL5_DIPCM|nr:hypothetical protein O6H91_20G070800 [Diphasiastrum complanatum]